MNLKEIQGSFPALITPDMTLDQMIFIAFKHLLTTNYNIKP